MWVENGLHPFSTHTLYPLSAAGAKAYPVKDLHALRNEGKDGLFGLTEMPSRDHVW
ncbi:hypothetical protein KSB_10620 [Ktedonobacter robiniae]|uniref:Uncharacterized protein n=1 Tax=Ktedonobacter robiniae TaxID=2778365 RepID=A0ABQ3UJJ8_9CHLR|nr:hypothetical protein KSB_10620 [Ktedonobacter robiniae]